VNFQKADSIALEIIYVSISYSLQQQCILDVSNSDVTTILGFTIKDKHFMKWL